MPRFFLLFLLGLGSVTFPFLVRATVLSGDLSFSICGSADNDGGQDNEYLLCQEEQRVINNTLSALSVREPSKLDGILHRYLETAQQCDVIDIVCRRKTLASVALLLAGVRDCARTDYTLTMPLAFGKLVRFEATRQVLAYAMVFDEKRTADYMSQLQHAATENTVLLTDPENMLSALKAEFNDNSSWARFTENTFKQNNMTTDITLMASAIEESPDLFPSLGCFIRQGKVNP